MRSAWLTTVLSVWLCTGCGDDAASPPIADGGDQDSGVSVCTRDSDCNDGVFCNGVERCMRSSADATADGCVAGTPPRCDDGLDCTTDTCSHLVNDCRFVPIDADGDGHAAATCVTNDGESLGDDCDDADANRYPGNAETCTGSTETHDEDCDLLTVGPRDADSDTSIDSACCNGARCGDDCDDDERRIAPGYPEICDGLDNDCDGRADVDTILARWFPDDDGDGFGRDVSDPIESCAPVAGRSLFNTDRDDTRASINPAAVEVCDALDNDCDDMVDEKDVCVCGVQGAAPCECASGSVDCLGDLIPRLCVSGYWVTSSACSGLKPICLTGRCVCPDGGSTCADVPDRSPPFVLGTAPGISSVRVSLVAVVAVVLSEPPAPSSVNPQNFRLLDGNNVEVDGSRTIDDRLVSFTPTDPLLPGRIYTVVFENVTDRVGNAMRSSLSWRFATAVANIQRSTINAMPDRGFSAPHLVVGEGGQAAVAAAYNLFQGDTVTPSSEVFSRGTDGLWVPTGWLAADYTTPFVGLSDDGTLVGATPGYAPAVYTLPVGETGWGDATPLTSLQTTRALSVHADRYVMVAAELNSISIRVTQLGGVPVNLPTPSGSVGPNAFDVAIDSVGHVALVATGGTGVFVGYWNGSQWTTRTFSVDAPTAPSVRINESGEAIATWLYQQQRFGISLVYYVDAQQVVRFDAATTAIPDAADLTQSATHSYPKATWLSDGAALLMRGEPHVTANRVETDGTIGSLLSASGSVDGSRVGDFDVAALSNGDALAVWIQDSSLFGSRVLLAARYVNGVWLPVEALADTLTPSNPQVEALPDGTALVVWQQDDVIDGVSIVLD